MHICPMQISVDECTADAFCLITRRAHRNTNEKASLNQFSIDHTRPGSRKKIMDDTENGLTPDVRVDS